MPERTVQTAYDLLLKRVDSTLAETGQAFPYHADPETGEWTTTRTGNWCGGHWIHMLWLAYEATGEDRYAAAARDHTATMHGYMPRDSMFCGLNFHFAGFRGYDVSGAERERDVGIEGAEAMRAYYHEGARVVPVGTLEVEVPPRVADDFRDEKTEITGAECTATDALHTALPVLWRAYRETNDPHYRDVAVSHADRHLDWVIRDDGSTWNVVQFDPETGALVAQFNDLAYSDETTWARGQGWCVAGLCRAYAETEGQRYLSALRDVMNYYERHAPEDMVPYWDFEHPDVPDVPRDTSCAAISAYGLSLLPEVEATADLRAQGDTIVRSLIEDYLTPQDTDTRPAGMTLDGCYNGPRGYADHHELIWTDHYLMAALHERIH